MNIGDKRAAAKPANAARFQRQALLFGLGGVFLLGALAFDIYETYRLSRYFGGFKGMEAVRPAHYPGNRLFLLICILAGVAGIGCLFRAFQFSRNARQAANRYPADSPAKKFRELRERAGLTPDEVARRFPEAISAAAIYDIESNDEELCDVYSPADIRKFSEVLGARPAEFFGIEINARPLSAEELVQLIQEACRSRNLTLAQFEEAVGWRLSQAIEPPSKLLEEISIEGLQWLCQELGIDWRRVIIGL